ncbi:MAG TPA: arylesterase, partial [bacterium]|nr:arylesterase [bacterium]
MGNFSNFKDILMLFRLVLLLIGLNANLVYGQEASSVSSPRPTLLVLGDSLSAAHNIPEKQGWVTLMSERLARKTPPWTVINASVSGETSSGGLSRLPNLLASHKPQWVMLELGANDGLRGLPLKNIRANLQKMIQLSQASGAKVILIGIMLPPNYGAAYRDPFARMYRELAEQNKLTLVPFLLEGIADNPSLMQPDGLHPTALA